jgi:hypothetical protein
MKKIKILHIDPDYQGHLVTIQNGQLCQLLLYRFSLKAKIGKRQRPSVYLRHSRIISNPKKSKNLKW